MGLPVLLLWGCFSGPGDQCQKTSDCPAGRYCDATLKACLVGTEDAGSWGVSWVTPVNGARVGSSAVLSAKVTVPTGATAPASLTAHGTLASSDAGVDETLTSVGNGLYSVTWAPGAEGDYSFQALLSADATGGSGVLSAPLSVTVDLSGPAVEVAVVPAPTRPVATGSTTWEDPQSPGAFRRDETTQVTVSSDASDALLGSAKVMVVGAATPAPAPVEVTLGPCSVGNPAHAKKVCREGTLDLSVPSLMGMRGEFQVTGQVKDDVGNSGTAQATVKVTRWKWAYDAGTDALSVTPAVGHAGAVYVASNAGTAGSLTSVAPDGTVAWSDDTGALLTAPAVGETADGGDRIYVAQATTAPNFGIVAYAADGNQVGTTCTANNSTGTSASLSIAPATGGQEVAMLAVKTSNATPVDLLGSQVGAGGCFPSYANASLNPPFPEGALAGDGTTLFYGTPTGGTVVKYSLSAGAWTDNSGWSANVQLTVPSVAVTDAGIAGGGGNSVTGEGGLFALDEATDAITWTYPNPSPSAGFGSVGDVIAGESGQLFASVAAASNELVSAHIGQDASSFVTKLTSVAGAPILGADGQLYTVSPSASLSVWNGADLTPLWSGAVASGANVAAAPNMDCTRDGNGAAIPGRPGVLYVPTTTGKLYAIIVDSRGIDVHAAWPKYLHDPRNTSNAKTDLSKFACP